LGSLSQQQHQQQQQQPPTMAPLAPAMLSTWLSSLRRQRLQGLVLLLAAA
jgi:hypothetical protein